MRTHLLIAAALALSATVTSANALTVVNSDKLSHAIMVTPQGGKAHRLVIKANRSGHYDCAQGCELRLGPEKAHFQRQDPENLDQGRQVRPGLTLGGNLALKGDLS